MVVVLRRRGRRRVRAVLSVQPGRGKVVGRRSRVGAGGRILAKLWMALFEGGSALAD
jgi:hypothetical protein